MDAGKMTGHSDIETAFVKEYTFQAERGSKAGVRIEAKIKDLCREDLEEILHEYASCTHNFYLGLGKKIAGGN